MQKLFRVVISLWLASLLFAPSAFANAEDSKTGLSGAGDVVGDVAGKGGYETANPDIIVIAGLLVNTLLGLLGIIFVILTIYAGYQWMTAQGEEDQVKQAKATITNSVIGIIVVLGAWAVYGFVINILTT